jgi:hypothetical protein
MVRPRHGRSMLGCLFSLLIIVAAFYFAFNLAEPYWRYYQYKDSMSQEARFASQVSNEEITRRLHAKADSLGLPAEAYRLRFNRTANSIQIWAEYGEVVELPGYTRHFVFKPRVEAPL